MKRLMFLFLISVLLLVIIGCDNNEVITTHEIITTSTEVNINVPITTTPQIIAESEPFQYAPENQEPEMTIRPFYEGLAVIMMYEGSVTQPRFAVINEENDYVIPFGVYNYISDFIDGFAVVSVNGFMAGGYGIIDKYGNEIIPSIYSLVTQFSEGLAAARLDGKWGFINKEGNIVIPHLYDTIYQIPTNDGSGSPIGFRDGLAAVGNRTNDDDLYWKIGWGFIDKKGNEVIPLIYDLITPFREGRAIVYLMDKNPEGRITGYMSGLINTSGNMIVQIDKYRFICNFYNGLAAVRSHEGKYGFIDLYGNIIIPFIYDEIGDPYINTGIPPSNSIQEFYNYEGFSIDLIPVSIGTYDYQYGRYGTYNGKWGFVDKTGEIIVPLEYDYATITSDGIIKVNIGGTVHVGGEWGNSFAGGEWIIIDINDYIGR